MERDADFLREGVRVLAQALMELELDEHLGAERHERTEGRTGHRNGYRQRSWDTRVGTIELAVPRVRDGSFSPSLLEPRRRAERALVAVVQEAYVHGVTTRRVDDLVKALGMDGISKSQVSEAVRRTRQGGRAFQHPAAGRPVPVRVVGRHLRQGARARAGGLNGDGHSHRGEREERASGRCWVSTWGQARMGHSGPRSCASWSHAG